MPPIPLGVSRLSPPPARSRHTALPNRITVQTSPKLIVSAVSSMALRLPSTGADAAA